jgi:hypothetical protein
MNAAGYGGEPEGSRDDRDATIDQLRTRVAS